MRQGARSNVPLSYCQNGVRDVWGVSQATGLRQAAASTFGPEQKVHLYVHLPVCMSRVMHAGCVVSEAVAVLKPPGVKRCGAYSLTAGRLQVRLRPTCSSLSSGSARGARFRVMNE